MLKYICFWKLKEGIRDEEKRLIHQYLDELPRRIGYVRSWTWGEAISTTGDPFTHGFTAEFDNVEALTGYLGHPDRLTIEKQIAPYIERSLAAHYELGEFDDETVQG